MPSTFTRILCADWSKEPAQRAVAVADVQARTLKILRAPQWTLDALLRIAKSQAEAANGPVLVGLDLPLGAPVSLMKAASAALGKPEAGRFVDWLGQVANHPRFFEPCMDQRDWSPLRPFIRVPSGVDGLKGFERAAGEKGIDLYRGIDRGTGAKSLFVTSGIPGSVGSSVVDVWPGLLPLRARGASFAVWPAETGLDDAQAAVVLGEIYPRAMYGLALGTAPAGSRSRVSIAKTQPAMRTAALLQLRNHEWVRTHGVTVEHVEEAGANEDAFDALVSAAALLRCALEGTPLGWKGADASEGGILGCDSLDLAAPERVFSLKPDAPAATSKAGGSPFLDRPQAEWVAQNAQAFAIRDAVPVSPGHTLVVTRRVVSSWFEATPGERNGLLALVEVVKQQLDREKPRPDGYTVGFDVGEAAGQEVPHLHVHVIPRYAGDAVDGRGGMRSAVPRRPLS